MFYLFSKLMIILAMVICNEGQEQFRPSSQHDIKLIPGEKQSIASPNYSDNYPDGTSWSVSSPHQINLTCDVFNMPLRPNCSGFHLEIYDNGNGMTKNLFGDSPFSVISSGNELRITLKGLPSDSDEKFSCSVETFCECGNKNPTRISYGQETGVNEYPMMACIAFTDWTESKCFCGAVIINARQVLTTADCVLNLPVHKIRVLVGEHDTRTSLETNATRLLNASSVATPKGSWFDKDNIAVVTTIETIGFNREVSPVCLPYGHKKDSFEGYEADIVGRGGYGPAEGEAPTMSKAITNVLSNDVCKRKYSNLTPEHICTQHPHTGSCTFDSGGPILWQSPATRRLILLGILSERPFCNNGEPVKNTRVSAFLDWIDSQAPPGIGNCKRE